MAVASIDSLEARIQSIVDSCRDLERSSSINNVPAKLAIAKLNEFVTQAEVAISKIKESNVPETKLLILKALIDDVSTGAEELERLTPGIFRDTIVGLHAIIQQVTPSSSPDGWRQQLCRNVKAAFEYLLEAMLKHLGITPAQSIHDKLLLLKDTINTSRINMFFDVKDLVNVGAHGSEMSVLQLQDLLTSFRRVVIDSRSVLLMTPQETLSRAKPKINPLYKTVLCRNWTRCGKCPLGDKCSFAHGSAELVQK